MEKIIYNHPICAAAPAAKPVLAARASQNTFLPAGLGKKPKRMTDLEQIANLEKIPLFSGMTRQQLDWLRGRLYVRTFPANKDLIITGTPGDMVYIILTGTVKVYMPQLDGEDVIVAILGPGDPVGEMSVIDHTGRSASVITLEETLVLWMNQADFKEAMGSMPVLSHNLIRILSGRLRSSTGQIQALAALDVNGRVIRQLLTFASRYGQLSPRGQEEQVLIPIRLTQNDLAGLVGASRKRVNQAIVTLKRRGWIAIDAGYHITLLNAQAMESSLD